MIAEFDDRDWEERAKRGPGDVVYRWWKETILWAFFLVTMTAFAYVAFLMLTGSGPVDR